MSSFQIVRHVNQGRVASAKESFQLIEKALSVRGVESMAGLVEDEKLRFLHERPAEKHQLLLSLRKLAEAAFEAPRDPQSPEPLRGAAGFLHRRPSVEADRVVEAGADDLEGGVAAAVEEMELGGDAADAPADLPDGVSTSAPPSEERNVVRVGLRVVGENQAQER